MAHSMRPTTLSCRADHVRMHWIARLAPSFG